MYSILPHKYMRAYFQVLLLCLQQPPWPTPSVLSIQVISIYSTICLVQLYICISVYLNMYIKMPVLYIYMYIQTFAPICCIPSFNLDIFLLLLLLVYIYSAYFIPFRSSDCSHYPHYSLRFDFNLFYYVFVCHTLPLLWCVTQV